MLIIILACNWNHFLPPSIRSSEDYQATTHQRERERETMWGGSRVTAGKMVWVAVVGVLSLLLVYAYNALWRRPERIRERLRRQGIRGPAPSYLVGNIREMSRHSAEEAAAGGGGGPPRHDYFAGLYPYFARWSESYGPVYLYSTGNIVLLYVSDPDLVKEINHCNSLDLGKPSYMQRERGPLFGRGILASNGPLWAHQRKIIAPELYMDKVKRMVDLMVESTIPLLESWDRTIERGKGIADMGIDEGLRVLSADVISRACFGNSYEKGKEIFSKIRALQDAMSVKSILIGIPGFRHIPTKTNRKIWRAEKEVESLILKVVRERNKGSQAEHDLLQAILEGAKDNTIDTYSTDQFIVDNCKNIYFAGHDTIAVAAAWSMVLLASNPDWQRRAREEVGEVCCGQLPDADMIRKMKTLTMVIQEALRLYPPAQFVSREALQNMKLRDINIPKGANIWVPISSLHQDPNIWGPDAGEFNPDRFSRGISNACKHPHVYIPFGVGARTCVGQNFAMVELKVVLSLILSRFTFSLSPKYRHSVAFRLTVVPEYGVDLLMQKVQH